LSDDTLVSAMALSLAEAGIAHYAIHTNLDKARGGVSFELASRLGLQNIRFLGDLRDSVVKLVIFVPVDSVDAVRDAAHAAGGGQIGAYSHCSFSHGGTGQYLSGKSGSTLQRVNEVRLELEVARWRLRDVVASIKDVHPYEEVAYDVIALEQSYRDAGLGALGELAAPVSLSEFMNSVCASLANPALRFAGDPEHRRVRHGRPAGRGGAESRQPEPSGHGLATPVSARRREGREPHPGRHAGRAGTAGAQDTAPGRLHADGRRALRHNRRPREGAARRWGGPAPGVRRRGQVAFGFGCS
ncbi:MAG: Nif3-like dinuclear metal center hexameric protein, partial [Chloroflexi bacterium]|nr:Nif3-like dinuclear metal center hexameric protein [Chloroflexota bacterium]